MPDSPSPQRSRSRVARNPALFGPSPPRTPDSPSITAKNPHNPLTKAPSEMSDDESIETMAQELASCDEVFNDREAKRGRPGPSHHYEASNLSSPERGDTTKVQHSPSDEAPGLSMASPIRPSSSEPQNQQTTMPRKQLASKDELIAVMSQDNNDQARRIGSLESQLSTKHRNESKKEEKYKLKYKVKEAENALLKKQIEKEVARQDKLMEHITDAPRSQPVAYPVPVLQDNEEVAQLKKELGEIKNQLSSLMRENSDLRDKCREMQNEKQFSRNNSVAVAADTQPTTADTGLGLGLGASMTSWGNHLSFLNPQPDGAAGEEYENENSHLTALNDSMRATYDPYNSHSTIGDVGIQSLEEFMGGDSDDEDENDSVTLSPKSSFNIDSAAEPATVEGKVQDLITLAGDNDRPIDEQLADNNASFDLMNLPKPGILKVGFSCDGVVRGIDFDLNKLPPAGAPTFPRHGRMQTYNRFKNSTGGPRSQEEIDNEKKQAHLGFFDSREEREDAINNNKRLARIGLRDGLSEKIFPGMLRHGVEYRPKDGEANIFCSVLIQGIPENVHLREVLDRVRGGSVITATLVNTMSLTGSMSARVVFKTEDVAREYAEYVKFNPISLTKDDDENAGVVTVHIIDTATFPISSKSQHYLAAGTTRCLLIRDLPASISITFLENTFRKSNMIEHWLDEQNNLHMQFSSIQMAEHAWQALDKLLIAAECEADPCAGPLEELQLPVKSRPPMFPKHRKASDPSAVQESYQTSNLRFGQLRRSDSMVKSSTISAERKPLAVLTDFKLDIPSFSGTNIRGVSWADEVEEEESGDFKNESSLQEVSRPESGNFAPPNSPTDMISPNITPARHQLTTTHNENLAAPIAPTNSPVRTSSTDGNASIIDKTNLIATGLTNEIDNPIMAEAFHRRLARVSDLHHEHASESDSSTPSIIPTASTPQPPTSSIWAPRRIFPPATAETPDQDHNKEERTMHLDGPSDPKDPVTGTQKFTYGYKYNYTTPNNELDELLASRSGSRASSDSDHESALRLRKRKDNSVFFHAGQGNGERESEREGERERESEIFASIDGVLMLSPSVAPEVKVDFLMRERETEGEGRMYDIVAATHLSSSEEGMEMGERESNIFPVSPLMGTAGEMRSEGEGEGEGGGMNPDEILLDAEEL